MSRRRPASSSTASGPIRPRGDPTHPQHTTPRLNNRKETRRVQTEAQTSRPGGLLLRRMFSQQIAAEAAGAV
jgi:hypothetical protein